MAFQRYTIANRQRMESGSPQNLKCALLHHASICAQMPVCTHTSLCYCIGRETKTARSHIEIMHTIIQSKGAEPVAQQIHYTHVL